MEHGNKTALIAMSGGVDSSVTAYLMKEAGFDCLGANMRLYHNEDIGLSIFKTCCTQSDIDDAASVAEKLGIPFEVKDFTSDFKREVIDKFIRTYEEGGTPNPCIDCNRHLKFCRLMAFAREKGRYYVATGHYARIEEKEGRFLLRKAKDLSKDQTYVLYNLTQEELAHVKFPLGEMANKEETRKLAESLGLVNAHKRESQDICFVPDGDYVGFMEKYQGKKYAPGNFLDLNGKIIGQHRGAVHYTLGQRKGLGLSLGEPVYVCAKDMARNTVTVGPETALFHKELLAGDMNWIAIPKLEAPLEVLARTRYSQKEQPATAYPAGAGKMKLVFREPQRAITPGQAVVLYTADNKGYVVGGGTIEETLD